MTEKTIYDVIVIGAGPGGYVAAIRGAQLGFRVLCIDERAELGGTCLNVGCIPSKALLHSSHKYHEAKHDFARHGIDVGKVALNLPAMLKNKDDIVDHLTRGIKYLFNKNKITFVQGRATLTGPHGVSVEGKSYGADAIVIATGSQVAPLSGVVVDEKQIVSSTGALSLKKVPKNLMVVGGGYIGLELGSVWSRLGSQVTVVEYAKTIVPAMDAEMGRYLKKSLESQGLAFRLETGVVKATAGAKGVSVVLKSPEGKEETVTCDVLLSCAGRLPNTQGLGLEDVGVKTDDRGRIQVNHDFETSVPSIYAIGDVIQGPMLAHKAEEEGVAVMELLAGQKPKLDHMTIPSVIYTMPEVASVGMTEEMLKDKGIPYRVGKFPFLANSRARAVHSTEGMVKILIDTRTERVLGTHIIHAHAGTLIAEATLAMSMGACADDIARTCHAHPTESEAVKEAALDAMGRAIHI